MSMCQHGDIYLRYEYIGRVCGLKIVELMRCHRGYMMVHFVVFYNKTPRSGERVQKEKNRVKRIYVPFTHKVSLP